MRDRGSALFTTVIAVMVLLLISGVFFAIVMVQSKTETSEEKGLKAYYLAEAGLNAGVADVLNRRDEYFVPGPTYPTPSGGPNPPWQDYGGGRYEVTVQIQLPNTFIVTSTGFYPDQNSVKRKLSAQYTLPLP